MAASASPDDVPRAVREEEDSMAKYLRMAKIDMHIHANTPDPTFLEQAQEDNFVRLMSMNAPVPFWKSIGAQWDYVADLRARHGAALGVVSTFSVEGWSEPNWVDRTLEHLKATFRAGALGVKIWKNLGMEFIHEGKFVMPDDPKLDPIYDYVEREGKTLVAHCGEPRNCWLPLCEMTTNNDRDYFRDHPEYHMHLHPDYPAYEEQIAARDRMLAKHPGLRFCGAHLASLEWSTDILGKWLGDHPHLCVDLSDPAGAV
uniref:Amidohydrolase-related domain-containing protein n=1 Tax=Eutreptiella gymnastica TaxID=73025 RepID=A0A7S1J8E0_9EUGL